MIGCIKTMIVVGETFQSKYFSNQSALHRFVVVCSTMEYCTTKEIKLQHIGLLV